MLVVSFALLMLYVNSYHTMLYTMILKGRTFYRNTIYVDSTKVFDIRDMIVLYKCCTFVWMEKVMRTSKIISPSYTLQKKFLLKHEAHIKPEIVQLGI